MTPPLQPLIHPSADPFLTEDQPDPDPTLWGDVLSQPGVRDTPCGPVREMCTDCGHTAPCDCTGCPCARRRGGIA